MTETTALRDVADRVQRAEARLERLLASGWRNAGAEAADLAEAADALREVGLPLLAERLRRVTVAADGATALPAIALALAACRQLRAHVAADSLPPGDWAPLAPPRRSVRTPDRLIPLGRLAVGQEEVWACIRLRGQWAGEYYLVDPLAPGEVATDGQEGRAAAREVATDSQDGQAAAVEAVVDGRDRTRNEPAWLRCALEGWLAWEARYPLGASGEVERCRLAGGKVVAPNVTEAQVVTALVQALSKPKDGVAVLGAGGLRLRQLERAEAGAYVWPDPAAAAAFAGLRDDKAWALAWVEGAAIRPLVLLSPAWFFQQPALMHLVPGLPQTRLK